MATTSENLNRKGSAMKRASTISGSVIALALVASAPSSAQGFGGADLNTMEQFAPVLEIMKRHMGKRQFGELMRTVGPIMDEMMTGEGPGAGGGFGPYGGLDAARIMPHINAETIGGLVRAFEPIERPRGRRKRAR